MHNTLVERYHYESLILLCYQQIYVSGLYRAAWCVLKMIVLIKQVVTHSSIALRLFDFLSLLRALVLGKESASWSSFVNGTWVDPNRKGWQHSRRSTGSVWSTCLMITSKQSLSTPYRYSRPNVCVLFHYIHSRILRSTCSRRASVTNQWTRVNPRCARISDQVISD